jgi:hypothetical protein
MRKYRQLYKEGAYLPRRHGSREELDISCLEGDAAALQSLPREEIIGGGPPDQRMAAVPAEDERYGPGIHDNNLEKEESHEGE